MKIEIYSDGSDKNEMIQTYLNKKNIKGFTTNPSLMRKAGVVNYTDFLKEITDVIKDAPISFEVFADDIDEMEKQANTIASYGSNIFVKIPVTNTKGESTKFLIKKLLDNNIKVNVTAVMTKKQIKDLIPYLQSRTNVILSIFAGRIADTGIDPKPIMKYAIKNISNNVKVLWASPREVFNIYEADKIGCHIITVTPDLINKLTLQNKNLKDYSLDTVKMFFNDAKASNYSL
jgi:transaldolase